MTKTHFTLIPGLGPQRVVCNRVVGNNRHTQDVRRVTCVRCRDKSEYQEAYRAFMEKREADFQAQEPHQVRHLMNWTEPIVCTCGSDLWRERPRSLFSFHYVCSTCGRNIHPPTETGMST